VATQQLFNAIAAEVEAACNAGQLRCEARQSGGIVPLLCGAQWGLVPGNFTGYVLDHIIRARHSGFSAWSYEDPKIDRIHPEMLAAFERITSQKMSGRSDKGAEFPQPAAVEIVSRQERWRSWMGTTYERILPWIFGLGGLAVLLRLRFWRDAMRPWWLIVLAALAVQVLLRATAFSYLSTVDGYLNIRYISVCYPVAAAVAVLAAGELRHLPWIDRHVASALPHFSWMRRGSVTGLALIALIVTFAFVYSGKRSGEAARIFQAEAIGPEGKVVREGEQEFLELTGKRIPVLPDRQGWLYLEAGWLRGNIAVFDGWGMDIVSARPARSILLFADGNLIATATPSFSVPEVEKGFAPNEFAGFRIDVPGEAVAGRTVRVFALQDGDRAGELAYPRAYYYGEEIKK
jgi:hypothetical protein